MNLTNSETFTQSLRLIPQSEFEAEYCRRSLLYFVKTFWHIVEPKTPFISNWHIEAICEHLEAVTRREIHNLLINIPPHMLKSTLVAVMWPAWVWIFQPEHRWLCSTYAQNLSRRDAMKMRRIVESPLYASLFQSFKFQEDQNTKDKFENDKTGCRISTAVGGIVTGEGGDTLMTDDPHNAREIHSEAKRQTVLNWWRESWSTRLNNENTGARVVVMQRLHQMDLSGWILENESDFVHLCLPMEYVPTTYVTVIGFADPRTIDGELLFPERVNQEKVEAFKLKLGSVGYSGQMQQSPVPAGGNIIQLKDLRFYKEVPTDLHRKIITADMSFEGEEISDYNVVGLFAKRGADIFMLPAFLRGLWNFPQAMMHMEKYFKDNAGTGIKIEKKANGHAALQIFKKKFSGVLEYEPPTDKTNRLYAVLAVFQAGNFWLPDPSICPWVSEVVKELLFFPKARHDDCVDIITMGIDHLNSAGESQFETIGTRKYG